MMSFLTMFFVSYALAHQGVPDPCSEMLPFTEKILIPLKLGPAKSDARFEDARPLKQAIETFIAAHPNWKYTEIQLLSSSSYTPIQKPKSVRDEKEIQRVDSANKLSNKQLAEVRKGFAEKTLAEMKASHSVLTSVPVLASSGILGPKYNYNPDPRLHDQNLGLVVPGFSQDYEKRVSELFDANKADYAQVGIVSVEQLLNQDLYKSLYEVKFKPFQGFFVSIKGQKKSPTVCTGTTGPAGSKGSATKQ